MPEETQTPEAEQQTSEPQEPAGQQPQAAAPSDPWADADTARKEIEKLRRENAAHRTKNKELEPLAAKAKELEESQKTEQQRLGEQLVQEQERAQKALRAAVTAKVEALAAKTFADPEDAPGALDLASYLDEAGAIDAVAIEKDLADLLKRKPHWAKQEEGPRRPAPDRSQGSSGNGNRTPSDPGQVFAGFMKQGLERGR